MRIALTASVFGLARRRPNRGHGLAAQAGNKAATSRDVAVAKDKLAANPTDKEDRSANRGWTVRRRAPLLASPIGY